MLPSLKHLTGSMRRSTLLLPAVFAVVVTLWCDHTVCSAEEHQPLPQFERIVIDDNFPGAYQVEVADVNGDGKPDIVALGGGTCAWYENPTWKKRIVTNPKQTPGIISTATADLDGDGKAEIAIAYEFSMNEPTKGKLLLAHPGKQFDDAWTLVPVADIGSIHRLRWMKSITVKGEPKNQAEKQFYQATSRPELVVAPLYGPSAKPPKFQDEPAQLTCFSVRLPKDELLMRSQSGGGLGGGGLGGGGIGGGGGGATDIVGQSSRNNQVSAKIESAEPKNSDQKPYLIKSGDMHCEAPVIHAIQVVDIFSDIFKEGSRPSAVLVANNLGITMNSIVAVIGTNIRGSRPLVPGAPGEAPNRGASEIQAGRLKDGRQFLATIEPWHGTNVAIYNEIPEKRQFMVPTFGTQKVIDSSLKEGHALWVADVDGDGDDEVFAGYRGQGTSLIGYDFDGVNWNRTVIDTAIAAQDLRGGDIDGDGTPDFVGVGGSTHNVVWYRTKKP